MKLTLYQKEQITDLLWNSLKKGKPLSDGAETRETGWGTKTRHGLIQCIRSIVQNRRPE